MEKKLKSKTKITCGHGENSLAKMTETFVALRQEVMREKPNNLVIRGLVDILNEYKCPHCRYGNFTHSDNIVGHRSFYCASYLLNALNFSNHLAGWETYVIDGLKMLKQVVCSADWQDMLRSTQLISSTIDCIGCTMDIEMDGICKLDSYKFNSDKNTIGNIGLLLRYLFEEGLDPNILCPPASVTGTTNTVDAVDAEIVSSGSSSGSGDRRLFENVLSSRDSAFVARQFIEFGANLDSEIIVNNNVHRFRFELITWRRISSARAFDSFWDYLAGKVSSKPEYTGITKPKFAGAVDWIAAERQGLISALDKRHKRKVRCSDLLKSFGYQASDKSGASDKSEVFDTRSVCVIHPLFSLVGVLDISIEYADQCWKNDDAKLREILKALKIV